MMRTLRRTTTRWTRTRCCNVVPSLSGLALMPTSNAQLTEDRLRRIYESYEIKSSRGGVSVDYVNTRILD